MMKNKQKKVRRADVPAMYRKDYKAKAKEILGLAFTAFLFDAIVIGLFLMWAWGY